MKQILILSFLLLINNCFGQKNIQKNLKFFCSQITQANDIENTLKAGLTRQITLECSPVGSGNKNEVARGIRSDKYYFEKEHNIIWILFDISKTGNLSFKINPENKKDDYDFLLFKNSGKFTIDSIKSKKLKPVRTNLARYNSSNDGVTGLRFSGNLTHTKSGPRNQFSKPLAVRKGKQYYLVLDNVYNKGKGAVIKFEYIEFKKINGTIIDDNNEKLLNTKVSWEDADTGEELVSTTTDKVTGKFEMEVPIDVSNPWKRYVLSSYLQNYFFAEKIFTPRQVKEQKNTPINLVLPKLRKGLKNRLKGINFKGGLPELLPSATASLKKLKKLMKKNKSLTILIEGHTNGVDNQKRRKKTTKEEHYQLSINRAKTVKQYLIEKGILENRITIKGFGDSKMLFPKSTATSSQQSKNRRVEILVTDYYKNITTLFLIIPRYLVFSVIICFTKKITI